MKDGELDWSNLSVTRLDDGAPTTLEVPELDADALDKLEREAEADEANADAAIAADEEEQQTYEPGTQQECPTCGRNVRVRKDGTLGVHKCEPKPQRGNRLETLPSRRPPTPKRVRDLSIALIASGVETGTAHILARPCGVSPDDVPSDLPDGEGMVGPIVDLIWPELPKGIQNTLSRIADESDLLVCALAWWEWSRTLSAWTREQRAYQKSLVRDRREATDAKPAGGTTEEYGDNVSYIQPFSPA